MKNKVLVLSHLGVGGLTNIAPLLQHLDYDVFVLSSEPMIERSQLIQTWEDMGLSYGILATKVIEHDQVIDYFGEKKLKEFTFCLSVWEGQRKLMAAINNLLGARDISAESVALIQDKHAARQSLFDAGLTSVRSYSIAEAELAETQFPNSKFVIKPYRGIGGLQTKIVDTLAGYIENPNATLVAEDDTLFSEYYADNHLYIEPFIEGDEFSFEVIMSEGQMVFGCEHHKVGLCVQENTILETGSASPAVDIDPKVVKQGLELCAHILAHFKLDVGCYHVEMKYDGKQWDLIEINPRIGGSLIYESVKAQFDYCLLTRWIETLAGKTPGPAGPRQAGAYFQVNYAQAEQTVAHIEENPELREPLLCQKLLNVGDTADKGSREIFAAQTLWATDLAEHSQQVKDFERTPYLIYTYVNCAVLN